MLETSHNNVRIWKYSPNATSIVQTTFEGSEQATAGIQKSSFQPGNMQDPHLQICLQMHVKFIWFSNASAKFWDLWTKISWPRSPKTSLEDLVTRPETCSHRWNTSLTKSQSSCLCWWPPRPPRRAAAPLRAAGRPPRPAAARSGTSWTGSETAASSHAGTFPHRVSTSWRADEEPLEGEGPPSAHRGGTYQASSQPIQATRCLPPGGGRKSKVMFA